jgi:RimJ/RimL family protein N-acetyltransferase
MPRKPLLGTERLSLRPPEEADLDSMVAGLNDWEVARFLARVPFPYSRTDAEAFLEATRRAEDAGTDRNLVIEMDGRVIGCLGLAGIRAGNEFGYWLARPDWGRGIATEAGRAFLDHCFESFGLDFVRAGAFADNPASLRVQWKLGFETAGFGRRLSLARGGEAAHIDTILTRQRLRDTAR